MIANLLTGTVDIIYDNSSLHVEKVQCNGLRSWARLEIFVQPRLVNGAFHNDPATLSNSVITLTNNHVRISTIFVPECQEFIFFLAL